MDFPLCCFLFRVPILAAKKAMRKLAFFLLAALLAACTRDILFPGPPRYRIENPRPPGDSTGAPRHPARGACLAHRRPLSRRLRLGRGYLRRGRSGLDRPLLRRKGRFLRPGRRKRPSGHAPVRGRPSVCRLFHLRRDGHPPRREGTVPVRREGDARWDSSSATRMSTRWDRTVTVKGLLIG